MTERLPDAARHGPATAYKHCLHVTLSRVDGLETANWTHSVQRAWHVANIEAGIGEEAGSAN